MRALVVFLGLVLFGASVKAQYDDSDSYGSVYDSPDRYFYEEDFDWRWDVRVRISDGINQGRITQREANRLYNKLERLERKEFAFQADGYFSDFEQQEIWDEVVGLNRQVGLELRDFDRAYYGYSGMAFRGYLPWYQRGGYDFYRFDRRGFGSIRLGYSPRHFYPRNHFYHRPQGHASQGRWNNRRNEGSAWNNSTNRNNRGENRNTPNWNTPRGGNYERRDSPRENRDRNYERGEIRPRNQNMAPNPSSRPARSYERRDANTREEILTPRGRSNESQTDRTRQRSSEGRGALPDRNKANDSGRGRDQ
jgi:hypothetical protein